MRAGQEGQARARERAAFRLFLLPLLALLLLLTIYPTGYALVTSLTSLELTRPRDPVRFVGLVNYQEMLGSQHFWVTLQNTVILVGGAVSLQFLLGFGLALLLDRPGRAVGIVRTLFLLPTMITPIVGALTWFLLYNPTYGVINHVLRAVGIPAPVWLGDPRLAKLSIILVDVWQWTPFVMLLLLAGLAGIPGELYEAARVEGAAWWQILRYIIVPVLRPLIGVILIFRTMDAFKIFDKIYFLTDGGPGIATESVVFHTYRQGFGFFRMGYASALSVMILALVIGVSACLVYLTQRRMA